MLNIYLVDIGTGLISSVECQYDFCSFGIIEKESLKNLSAHTGGLSGILKQLVKFKTMSIKLSRPIICMIYLARLLVMAFQREALFFGPVLHFYQY